MLRRGHLGPGDASILYAPNYAAALVVASQIAHGI
jgi:hypothetical protein